MSIERCDVHGCQFDPDTQFDCPICLGIQPETVEQERDQWAHIATQRLNYIGFLDAQLAKTTMERDGLQCWFDKVAKAGVVDSNVQTAEEFIAWIAALTTRCAQMEAAALENGGSGTLIALCELQDQLRDVLPEIGTCSGLNVAVRLIKQALTAALVRMKELETELEVAKCGEALCGHDHSTQYWELRANQAEGQATDAQEAIGYYMEEEGWRI